MLTGKQWGLRGASVRGWGKLGYWGRSYSRQTHAPPYRSRFLALCSSGAGSAKLVPVVHMNDACRCPCMLVVGAPKTLEHAGSGRVL